MNNLTFGPAYRYRASVRRVIDGDTYILDIDLGFRCTLAVNIRVHAYDAPEITGEDRDRGFVARSAAMKILSGATSIVVESYKDQRSFERWVADVYVDGVLIRDLLIADGHVKKPL